MAVMGPQRGGHGADEREQESDEGVSHQPAKCRSLARGLVAIDGGGTKRGVDRRAWCSGARRSSSRKFRLNIHPLMRETAQGLMHGISGHIVCSRSVCSRSVCSRRVCSCRFGARSGAYSIRACGQNDIGLDHEDVVRIGFMHFQRGLHWLSLVGPMSPLGGTADLRTIDDLCPAPNGQPCLTKARQWYEEVGAAHARQLSKNCGNQGCVSREEVLLPISAEPWQGNTPVFDDPKKTPRNSKKTPRKLQETFKKTSRQRI